MHLLGTLPSRVSHSPSCFHSQSNSRRPSSSRFHRASPWHQHSHRCEATLRRQEERLVRRKKHELRRDQRADATDLCVFTRFLYVLAIAKHAQTTAGTIVYTDTATMAISSLYRTKTTTLGSRLHWGGTLVPSSRSNAERQRELALGSRLVRTPVGDNRQRVGSCGRR